MDLLFVTRHIPIPTIGGTERATTNQAVSLRNFYGCNCHSLYFAKDEAFSEEFNLVKDNFNSVTYIHESELGNVLKTRQFLESKGIDYILIESEFSVVSHFRAAINGLNIKILFVHHFEPGIEFSFYSLREIALKNGDKGKSTYTCFLSAIYDLMLYPIHKIRYNERCKRLYETVCQESDTIVLLSNKYMRKFSEIGKMKNTEKFTIIPNSLSFEYFANLSDIKVKEPIVLIVSRLDEKSKRLSLALDIWHDIKKKDCAKGWKLIIVGEGKDKDYYLDLVERKRIEDVELTGRRSPVPYYLKSSILIMTSASESWGLTLTEAQQYGVVPIAFNSFPTLSDIVSDGVSGYIVNEGDIAGFRQKLLFLMENKNERVELSINGVNECKRFSKNLIANQWWNLLSQK